MKTAIFTHKGIAFAYSSSPLAVSKGKSKTGCFYVYESDAAGQVERCHSVHDTEESALEVAKALPGDWSKWTMAREVSCA